MPVQYPPWTDAEIGTLSFRKSEVREDYEPVLPDDMFIALSSQTTGEIVAFLSFVGAPICYDKAEPPIPATVQHLNGVGKQVLDDYRVLRELIARKRTPGIPGKHAALRDQFIHDYRIAIGDIGEFFRRAHHAAILVIAMFTGARISELLNFKRGCVVAISGQYFLKGTRIKKQGKKRVGDDELWVAIPILRDAVRVLELTTMGRKSLVCSFTNRGDKPLSETGFGHLIYDYVQSMAPDGRWRGIDRGPHRFRHTLTYHLVRADLQLPYVSYHLKHTLRHYA